MNHRKLFILSILLKNMEEARLQIGKLICDVTDVAISCVEDPIKKYKEFNARTNEVHKLVKNTPLSVRCLCEITSYDPSVFGFDTEFIIPITENDTPASIAEAVVNSLERRY